jgi:phosphatidylethanolamine-binding protein (PEBP) family uncharacterized protein
MVKNRLKPWILMLILIHTAACSSTITKVERSTDALPARSAATPSADLQPVAGSFLLTEGPASDLHPNGFTLTSPDVPEGGLLPVEYTCDGAANTLALSWSNAPAGTRSFAVIMEHVASPTDIHWYWVVYDIPANITSLPKNMTGIGTLGTNSVNDRQAYTPPCSKGPGPKTYTYTVYALSRQPQVSIAANQVTRAVLLDAIHDITLASAELNVTYTRK